MTTKTRRCGCLTVESDKCVDLKAHDALVEACKMALSAIEWSHADRVMTDEEVEARQAIKAALKAAEEKI